MSEVIDVSFACGSYAGYLAGAGVRTVIRYYSRDTGHPEKRLTRPEASAFAAAGLRLAVVHEAKFGDRIGSFDQDLGELDAKYAHDYAASVISQPANSAIYFGVDVDASAAQIRDRVIPYFQGVASAFSAAATPSYQVGVYGSGATCDAVLAAGLARYAWLAQSTGWAGYRQFLQSKRWALSQAMPTKIGELSCDPDQANGVFGDFFPAAAPNANVTVPQVKVMARNGLRLRAGPGNDFDVLRLLPQGTTMRALKSTGDWTLVDLAGDGASDGFVNSHFVAPD